MNDNLLHNQGFETDWSDGGSHIAFVFAPNGKFVRERSVGNIFTPPEWYTFFKEGLPKGGFGYDPSNKEGWCQPEVRDAWKTHDPTRVAEGKKATLLFTFFRVHDAGFLQRVAVKPGQHLRLTAQAHAWSNSKDGPHPDDARWSEGAGYNAGFILEGDTEDDDWRNFTFWLGIDPTGKTNPYANTVVWGRGAYIYNSYAQVPQVEVTAENDYITVFLRSQTLWRFKHNDAYWDDVRLVIVEPPAEKYNRVFWVYSDNMDSKSLETVQKWAKYQRRSAGWSHDDAINYKPELVNSNKVELFDFDEDKQAALTEWYKERSPETELVFRNVLPVDPRKKWEKYLLGQRDEPWKDVVRKGANCTTTIGEDGCWDTACAMAQRIFGIKPDATPLTVNEDLGPGGFTSNCEVKWVSMKEALGLQVLKYTEDYPEVVQHLRSGGLAFADVSWGYSKHFVLLVEFANQRFIALDPWKRECDYLDNLYGRQAESFRLLAKYETGEPQYPEPGEFLSLHIQDNSSGIYEYIATVQPEWVKLVENMQWGRQIKAISPKTNVLYRHVINNYNPYFNHSGGLRAGARLYLEQILDSLLEEADWIDAVEGVNETIATGDISGIQRTVEFECHYADWLYSELGNAVVPCLLNPGVGNPQHGEEALLMLPAAEQVVKYNGYLGGHTYIGFNYKQRYCTLSDSVRHFSMRPLLSWDVEFRKKGVYPQYIFTEGGGILIVNGSMPSATAGWRYKETCNGDWEWYKSSLLKYRSLVQAWNKEHGNRCRGQCIFTFPGSGEWEHFGISRKQLLDLSRLVG